MEPVHRSKLNATLYFEMCVLISKSYFWKIRYLYLVARRPLRLLSMSIVRRITQMSNIHRSQFLYHADFIGIFREVKTWEQKTQVVPFIVPSIEFYIVEPN